MPEEETDKTKEYTYTLPYLTDNTVLITRKGEDIDITKEINTGNNSRIYAGYKNDCIFRNWLADSNFYKINYDSITLADALEFILERKADFTILPYHMAQTIILEAGLTDQLTLSHTLFPIEYRIPVDIDDIETLVKLNDELLKLDEEGILTDIYFKKGIKSNAVIEQESRILKPAILSVLLISFCVLSFIYFIKYYIIYKKSKTQISENNEEDDTIEASTLTLNDKISFLTNRNSSISAKITENKNTDPYSGFYNTQYINNMINDCFVLYAKKGIPFSIAVIDTSIRNGSSAETVGSIKEEISKFLKEAGSDIIAAYNGFGVFYILFPNARQDDALRTINKADCHFKNFALTEYKGQDQYEFLGGLSL